MMNTCESTEPNYYKICQHQKEIKVIIDDNLSKIQVAVEIEI